MSFITPLELTWALRLFWTALPSPGAMLTLAGELRQSGGMYNDESSPTVTNCTFIGNC